MSFRRLIFLMLVAMGLLFPTRASAEEAAHRSTVQSIDQNSNRPQWTYITLLLITVARASLMVSTPSLRKSFLRWYFIVSTVRKSREAISSVV